MDEAAAIATLDAIYASATAPERWPEALRRLGEIFGCSCVSLVDKNRATSAGRAHQWGVDEPSQREYLDVWLSRNILHMHTRVWRPGEVETDQDVLPKQEFLRSDYYNGYLKPRDMDALLRVATHVDDETVQILALARPKSGGDYGQPDVERLRPLVQHVRRAALISRQLGEHRETLRTVSAILEQSSTGIVLLSRNGSVIFANRLAETIVARQAGLQLRGKRLTATRPRESSTLQRLIAGALGDLNSIDDVRGGAMKIAATAGAKPCTVVVGPLDGRDAIGGSSPAAFVLLADADRSTLQAPWILRSLYDLSATEALLAQRLMMGESPEQAAESLKIKISTARWHLSSMYRKTGTKRQVDLVRILLSLPSI